MQIYLWSIFQMNSVEVWKDIPKYNNYMVSNIGRVKSKDRFVVFTRSGISGKQYHKSKILSSSTVKHGYNVVRLSQDGNMNSFSVHRLVANAFIPNKDKKLEVNHKNGIKDDNRVENLEWNTKSENTLHAYKNKLMPRYKGCTLHGRTYSGK